MSDQLNPHNKTDAEEIVSDSYRDTEIGQEHPGTIEHPDNEEELSETLQKTDHTELEARSSEVQEIIGRPPHWLIRWGITFFFAVIAILFLISFIIQYPEVIEAPIRLTAIEAPQTLQSRIDGQMERLLVSNDEEVRQGQMLAWMESTAEHEEVLELSSMVDTMRSRLLREEADRIAFQGMDTFTNLGELQSSFQSFEQAWREFNAYLPGGYYSERSETLEQEMTYTRQLLTNLNQQQATLEREFELTEQEYERQQHLAANGHISPAEAEQAESKLLTQERSLQDFESTIINNRLSQIAKQREIMEIERQAEEQRAIFLQELNNLQSAIAEWKQSHVVTAPFEGNVIFSGVLQEKQTVNAGEDLFYIKPDNEEFFGVTELSQDYFGKVEEGQEVMVSFSGYPDHEYGTVHGKIAYISDIPVQDDEFFARVNFPEGLTTNYGIDLLPRNGMTGQAEIVTQDMRLAERIYNNITSEIR